MEDHKPPDPTGVGFFRAAAIVQKVNSASDPVQKLRRLWRTRRIRAFHDSRLSNARYGEVRQILFLVDFGEQLLRVFLGAPVGSGTRGSRRKL